MSPIATQLAFLARQQAQRAVKPTEDVWQYLDAAEQALTTLVVAECLDFLESRGIDTTTLWFDLEQHFGVNT
jgi:hypothetical protein